METEENCGVPGQRTSKLGLYEPGSSEKPGGCNISTGRAVLLGVVVVGALVAVGLGVHFGRPPCEVCEVTPTLSPDEQWEHCKQLAADRGECLCNETTPAPTPAALTGYRLNKTLIPSHYNVELKPDLYPPEPGLKIPGHVEIWMTCNETTDMLVIHIQHILIDENTITFRKDGPSGVKVSYSNWEEDTERNFFKLYFGTPLTVGETYYFRVEFQGTLNHPSLGGFYNSSYQEDGQTKYLASTMFQTSRARRAFPCFDNAFFKATFNITLVRKSGYTSLSNMDVLRQDDRGDGWVADVFHTTLPMPTYLLAFVVSEFSQKNTSLQNGTLIRHWSQKNYVNQLDFSLAVSGPILDSLEEYTRVANPLGKIDQIGIPRFHAGGMENWGFVIYTDNRLLIHPNFSTLREKRNVVNIISHELAHFWFGDLVTCEWWDDTFLNEGFATYFSFVGQEDVLPDTKEDSFFNTITIMETDGYSSSQPIRLLQIQTPLDAYRTFAGVTYRKGAALLRMIDDFLGHDTFRSALTLYLNRHAYGTVTIDDLYIALQEQAVIDNRITWDANKRNISRILPTWLDQQGYPIVHVSHRGGGKYFLSQEHFLYDPENKPRYDSEFGFTWDIPITYSTEEQLQSGRSNLTWMYREDIEIDTGDDSFILVNPQAQGFYRVNYEDQLWDKIVQKLNQDHKVFSVIGRHRLVNDALELAKAKKRPEVEAIKTTEYLINETDYLPWYAFNRRVDYYNRMFYNTETSESWQRYLLDRAVTSLYEYVGWNNTATEHHATYLRELILSIACTRGYGPCREEARRLYKEFMENENDNPIPPILRPMMYCEAIKSGGSAEWDFAYKMYEKEYTEFIADEKAVLQNAMACSRMPWILQKYLDIAVGWKSTSVIQEIAKNPAGTIIVGDFISMRWSDWPEGLNKANLFTTLFSTYSTSFELQKFEAIVKRFPDADMQPTFASIRATIQDNIRWMEANEVPLRNWFTSVNNQRSRGDTVDIYRLLDTTMTFNDPAPEFVYK